MLEGLCCAGVDYSGARLVDPPAVPWCISIDYYREAICGDNDIVRRRLELYMTVSLAPQGS